MDTTHRKSRYAIVPVDRETRAGVPLLAGTAKPPMVDDPEGWRRASTPWTDIAAGADPATASKADTKGVFVAALAAAETGGIDVVEPASHLAAALTMWSGMLRNCWVRSFADVGNSVRSRPCNIV